MTQTAAVNAIALRQPAALTPLSGSLDAYISYVNRLPALDAVEEKRLAEKLRDDGDLAAAQELVLSNLRFVVHIARGYMGYGLPLGDLIQEGNVGLMKAVKRFDPDVGVRLISFAVHWIKAEIHEYVLKNWRIVKIATTKAQRKLFFNLRSMKRGLAPMNGDDIGRIATALRVKPEEVAEMETRMSGQEIAFESDDDEDTYAPAHYLADPGAEPSQVLEAGESERLQADGLAAALAALDARSRRIVEARWLTEKDSSTLHDLAAEFKVSAERIRQIEAKAMAKMREVLKSQGVAQALPAPAA